MTDLVKKMSISGDFHVKTLGAQKTSSHFGIDDESANLDRNQLDETHGIETVPVADERDKTREKQNRKQPSRIEYAISPNRSRLVGNLDGKRRSKPIKRWLDYQTGEASCTQESLRSRVLLMNSCTHQEILKQYESR